MRKCSNCDEPIDLCYCRCLSRPRSNAGAYVAIKEEPPMVDKQKLLQWVEDKKFVYSEPYEEHDTPEDIAMYKGVVMILRVLQRDIERNNL